MTTTRPVAPPASEARARVQAVTQRHARRGGRATVRGRAYPAYLVALFTVFYLVPVVHARSTSPAPFSVSSAHFPAGAATLVCGLAVAVCWGGQLVGRFWGPLVVQPFLLHVLMSTDLSPAHYLGTIARRRLAYAGTVTLLALCSAAYLATDLFDRPATALPGLAVTAGISAVAAAAWLWGQVRPVRDNFLLAGAVGASALVVAAISGTAPDGRYGHWLAALVPALLAAAVGPPAFRALPPIDLARLARESARASQARDYAWTGTLHHALDLYRPQPRGFTSALVRTDGSLRGYLAQGAVRALRTPGRAAAAAVLLPVGGASSTHGVAGSGGGPEWWWWAVGSVAVYLGSGWVGETWRGLRDELTMAPLFGERWGGLPARALTWPVVAVTAGTFLGGALVALFRWPLPAGRAGSTVLLVAGSVVLVLGARFLREMKLQLPLELLLPVITPFGDLSGLRVVAWQFDGIIVVLTGVALMNAVPSATGAAALAVCLAAACVGAGLRRTGWAHRGLLSRLRRG
ncbi:hypothetical protein [Streptomyces anulatus]|uniref:hypothetical protein n=1 Tax=Streptomyces anulatus TaxID=1892 RepID=UPI001D19717F|nr:hypothetical protein [Streptomyces anulatus]